jgi:hypothetical protein
LTVNIRENLENGDWRVVGEAVIDGRPVTQLGAREGYRRASAHRKVPGTFLCIQRLGHFEEVAAGGVRVGKEGAESALSSFDPGDGHANLSGAAEVPPVGAWGA